MKVLVFLHGTVIMHGNGVGKTREERVRQVQRREASVKDFASYVPIGRAVEKLEGWSCQGAEIVYLSSHEKATDVKKDESVLHRYSFPIGPIVFRQRGEAYKDVADRVLPDLLIEDDCESIGGEREMTYLHLRSDLKARIRSIVVKEFDGIDHLPDRISDLRG
jgi:hypothetical protein